MKKAKSLLLILMVTVLMVGLAFAMTACADPCETHSWGEWKQNGTNHVRKCTVCGEKETHTSQIEIEGCDDTQHWGACAHDGCDIIMYEDHDENELCYVCGAHMSVLALYSASSGDPAHDDFARESIVWFGERAEEGAFTFEASTDWGKLNDNDLPNYDLVMFLNNKPGGADQKAAFQRYMENGGAWIGYHVCAFATNAKDDWNWYHNEFLQSGNFWKNTWNPTPEMLHVETHDHFATENLPDKFMSAPCEWYNWTNDLRTKDDVTVLLTLDETAFTDGGVGDKVGESWYTYEYCPIAWQNTNYNMIYMNMGHNLQDYNNGVYGQESSTFSVPEQNQFILDCMYGLVLGW